MNFLLTPDQEILRDTLGEVLGKECTPDKIRNLYESSHFVDLELWGVLADMGLFGILVPEKSGGLGLGCLELVLIMEQLGKFAFPGPIVEQLAGCIGYLTSMAETLPHLFGEFADQTLQNLLSGKMLASIALEGSQPIAYGGSADLAMLVESRAEPFLIEISDDLQLIDIDLVDRSYQLSQVVNLSAADIQTSTRATPLITEPYCDLNPLDIELCDITRRITFDRCSLCLSAQLLALASWILTSTVEYVKVRKQFGSPVGSYQARKHHLANARLAIEFARPPLYYAAYNLEQFSSNLASLSKAGDNFALDYSAYERDVSFAKVYASRAAGLCAKLALQSHGAIGYSWEHDLHMWMKRVWVLQNQWGTEDFHLDRVAQQVCES